MDRVQGIMAKIEEKASGKADWYPQSRKWLIQEDYGKLEVQKNLFRQRHMSILIQSLVFEKMNESNFGDTLTLMNYHVRSNIDAFRSD